MQALNIVLGAEGIQKQSFPFTPGVGLPNNVELWNLDFD